MSRYIVTGGSGFIGSNIVKVLLKAGNEVKVIDNLATGRESNLETVKADFEMRKVDIRDFDSLSKEFSGFDYVLHQAALPSVARSVENPYDSFDVNVLGTINVLKASLKSEIKRVVFASSSSIYGDSEKLPKSEGDPVNPLSPYAVSKYSAERLTLQFFKLYGLETVALRYFNVFGPFQDPKSQYAAVIPKFITLVLNNKVPEIYGDGTQSRDFTFIDNVVDANIKAALSPDAPGNVFNVACNERSSINDMVDILSGISGKEINPTFSESRFGDVKHSLADISKARSILKFEPVVKFKDGLEKTFTWFSEKQN